MRVSFLAVGVTVVAPPMAWALRVYPKEAPVWRGGRALNAEETPLPAPPLLAPAEPPVSALQEMMHKRDSSPQRPVVRQQPRRRNYPLFTSPEAAPPPDSSGLAEGVTPPGGVDRQSASSPAPVGPSGEQVAGEAASAPPQPTPASGPTATTFFGCVGCLAGCACARQDRLGKVPSAEELKAADEARARQEAEFRRQIVDVVKANMEDVEQRGAAAGGNKGGSPVGRLAMEALAYMTRAQVGSSEVILRDVREAGTTKQLLAQCLVRQTKVLGEGGTSVVIEVEIIDEACKEALKMDKLALKMMSGDPEGKYVSDELAIAYYQRSESNVEAETQPSKLVAGALRAGKTVWDVLKEKRWAAPIYTASAAASSRVYFHGGLVFTSQVLLSQLMLGDGWNLLRSQRLTPPARLPMPAREYACGEIIKSVGRLHELGYAHYDIKPGNILIGLDGSVNLADFGTCGPFGRVKGCREGVTSLFADPDQVRCILREGSLPIDPRYDTWSLGMTCYRLITTDRYPYGISKDRELEYMASLRSRYKAREQQLLQQLQQQMQEKQANTGGQWAAAAESAEQERHRSNRGSYAVSSSRPENDRKSTSFDSKSSIKRSISNGGKQTALKQQQRLKRRGSGSGWSVCPAWRRQRAGSEARLALSLRISCVSAGAVSQLRLFYAATTAAFNAAVAA
ncbi:hypothetical protein Emed_006393 [Eimeria media]